MKTNNATIATLALSALLAATADAAEAQTPNADQLLRQMSNRLASARTFTFKAKREMDPGLIEGQTAIQKSRVEVAVQRPNKVAGHATGKLGKRHFIADGQTLTLVDEKANHYSVVPMRTTIDGLVERIDKTYGFVPPLAEFALSNPYADFKKQAQSVTYLGTAKTSEGFLGLGGVECHRIGLKGKLADAELWITVNDQLPRKLVATFHREGQPQVRIAFSEWNLAASVTSETFSFTPPKGAEKIELWTTARMQSAAKP